MSDCLEVESLNLKILPHRRLLSSASFSIAKHQTIALMGPSGSGKTTLALSLMGLASPHIEMKGRIHFFGHPVESLLEAPKKLLARAQMIFQDPGRHLHPFFSVERHFKEILITLGTYSVLKMTQALEEVRLDPKKILKAYPHQLSGGEKQRVMLALCLSSEPALLIADEPTASLDFIVKVEILKLLKEIQIKRGLALILITHNPDIAHKMAQEVFSIKDEKLLRL